MRQKNKVVTSRRGFLSTGLKALAVAVPVVGMLALAPKSAEAARCRRCRRRRGGGCSTCG